MKYTVILELSGIPADAVAVEWTDMSAPVGSGAGWEPCLKLADGRWRFSSHDRSDASLRHQRDPGPFENIAIRYRMTPNGPWSPISANRKELTIVAVTAGNGPPPATAKDWPALARLDLEGGIVTAAFVLSGPAGGAVAVDWTTATDPGASDWTPCMALGDSRWHLGKAVDGVNLVDVGIRYRLEADGPASPVSEDRKSLDLSVGPPVLVVPALVTAPALAGAGKIGQEVTVDRGTWEGTPAPTFALQWCRDGADIPGAIASGYVPGPEDDLTDLTCRVTASNNAGDTAAETEALRVTYVAPTAKGELPDEIFDENTGPEEIPTAYDFEGENLRFGVIGAGASIDETTGIVSIPTAEPVSGVTVTVSATNSGGTETSDFMVTVEAIDPPVIPPAPVFTDAAVTSEWIDESAGLWRACLDLSGYAGGVIEAGRWTGLAEANARFGDPETFEPLEYDTADGLWKTTSADPDGTAHERRAVPADLRVQVQVDGDWSEISANTAPFLEAPGGVKPEPPVTTGTGFAKQLTSRTGWDVNQDVLGGWGEQTCIGGSQVGDYITVPGDMNGVNASRDGGKTWQPRPMRGFHANGGLSACHHPTNPDRLFVIANNAVLKNDDDLLKAGLYTSLDGGDTFERAIAVKNTRSPSFIFYFKQVQMNLQWIDFAPSNPDIGWAVIQQRAGNYSDQSGKVDYMQAGLYKTTDGGLSWKAVEAFPNFNAGNRSNHKFGHIWVLRIDPKNPNKLYLGCESGLYVATNPTGDGSFSRIRGAWNSRGTSNGNTDSGTLANPSCRSIYFMADGKVYYTIDHDGLYRGTGNDLEGATRRYNANAQSKNDGRIYQIAVSPVDTDNVWFFRGTRADNDYRNFKPLFSEDGGGSWKVCQDDLEGPNNPIPLHQKLNGENVTPYPSPTDAKTCIVDRGNRVRCTDGIQFLKYQDGWTGAGSNAVHVDPTRPNMVVVGVTDRGSWQTSDYGRTWEDRANVNKGGDYVGPTNRPGQSVLSLPGDNGWLVGFGSGDMQGQQKVRFYYEGSSLRQTFPDGTNQHVCLRMCLDADGRTVYAGTRKSSNYGLDNWSNVATPSGGGEQWFGICTASPQTSGVVWGMRRDKGNANTHQWFRATNGGATAGGWASIASQTDTSINTTPFTGSRTSMCAHPTDDTKCFVHSKAEVYLIGTGGLKRALGFKAFSQSVHGSRPLLISAIAVDHHDPNIVYVAIGELGGYTPLYRSTNALSGAPVWEDASGQVGHAGGRLAGGISAGATSARLASGTGAKYPEAGICRIGNEFMRFTRTGDTLALTERGIRNSAAAAHGEDATVTDYPVRGFIPCFENRDLAISPTCGTVIWVGRGTGWYAVAPPDGYRPAGGSAAGDLFDRAVTAEDFG